MEWTRSGLWPQAVSAERTILAKYTDDQAVCSLPLTTIALPANKALMIGPMRL